MASRSHAFAKRPSRYIPFQAIVGRTLLVALILSFVACVGRNARGPIAFGNGRENVREHGARGDGVADDSRAFEIALAAVCDGRGGTLYVPAGRYRLTRSLRLLGRECSNTVLEGDGPASTLAFEPGIAPRVTFDDRAIYAESRVGDARQVALPIAIGDTRFVAAEVQDTTGLARGDWVVIFERDQRAGEIVVIDWAQVKRVHARTVEVEHPFRTSFPGKRPWIIDKSGLGFMHVKSLLENVTIRDLRIINATPSRSGALINIGMALRTRLDALVLDNLGGNGIAIYRAKDLAMQNLTILNGRKQANEIAASVDFRMMNCSIGFEHGEGADDSTVTAAISIDFGSAFFTVTSNTFQSAGNIAVMLLDGVHDGVFASNSIGWVRDMGIGVGQGVSARGAQRLLLYGNAFAGGETGSGNTCITFADSDKLSVPIRSTGNVIVNNGCQNFTRATGRRLEGDRYD